LPVAPITLKFLRHIHSKIKEARKINISYSLTESWFKDITAELSQTAMGILKADAVPVMMIWL
jgi:hypothetical protein